MFRPFLLSLTALLPATLARAEVPEVRFARQFSMGYLQFNVIEHEHLIQKHAAQLGIPDVKVTGVRFNGPTMMNDSLLSDSVDIVGGSPNGMFALWAKTAGTPREVRAIGALVTLPYVVTTTDPDIRTIADLGKCKRFRCLRSRSPHRRSRSKWRRRRFTGSRNSIVSITLTVNHVASGRDGRVVERRRRNQLQCRLAAVHAAPA